MNIVNGELIKNKKVILRLDLDVPLENGQVVEDFRLKAVIPTIELCLKNASKIVIIGHLGRPVGFDQSLSLKVVCDWFSKNLSKSPTFETDSDFVMLENLRFNKGEQECDLKFAKELSLKGDVFVNEAFAAYHKSASTTVLPTLLPHAAGLRFADEVRVLTELRDNPKKPLVVIIGGVKIEDKLPAVLALSKIADAVLVGGLLAKNIQEQKIEVPMNVMVGKLSDSGIDMAEESINAFISLVKDAKQIIWAGPLGKYEQALSSGDENPEGNIGNKKLAQAVVASGAQTIIGGGDTEAALKEYLDRFSFVSVGGGVMLKLLTDGTLPTIESLE